MTSELVTQLNVVQDAAIELLGAIDDLRDPENERRIEAYFHRRSGGYDARLDFTIPEQVEALGTRLVRAYKALAKFLNDPIILDA